MSQLSNTNIDSTSNNTQATKQSQKAVAESDEKENSEPLVSTTNWTSIVTSFDDMGLNMDLLRGIYSRGFEKPSAIQQRGIVPLINGNDIVAQAQSGTGKTATFSIGSLQRINLDVKGCQILILSPTRDLSQQTFRRIGAFGTYMKGLTLRCCVGGTAVKEDVFYLTQGIHVVVGTPGRIKHMISSGVLALSHLKTFILDEADEMLSRGFKEQIYDIFQYLPSEVQVGLFSATMPNEILALTKRFMRSNSVRILVKNKELTLDGLKQFYVAVEKEDYKFATLCDLYEVISIGQAVIFCNTKRKVNWLADKLKQNDFTVSFMHSGMVQSERELILREFRSGSTRILIATDLLARGIDVNSISLVINYDLPFDKETYIHRIGRAGRYGKKGCAINFVTDGEEQQLRELELFYSTKIQELPSDIQSALVNQ
jgi:translation initiation factor 4A